MPDLTPAQNRILTAARAGRTQSYTGRVRPAVERLVALGLVTATYDLLPTSSGPYRWEISVRPVVTKDWVEAAYEAMQNDG